MHFKQLGPVWRKAREGQGRLHSSSVDVRAERLLAKRSVGAELPSLQRATSTLDGSRGLLTHRSTSAGTPVERSGGSQSPLPAARTFLSGTQQAARAGRWRWCGVRVRVIVGAKVMSE